jgi:hypothetical protein
MYGRLAADTHWCATQREDEVASDGVPSATMTSIDLQVSALLFLLCFPASVVLWSVVLTGSGFVRNVAAMPRDFRLGLRFVDADKTGIVSPMTVPTGLFCLVVSNGTIPFLLKGQYGATSAALAIAYVVLQLLWLERIRRAAERSRRTQ